jgi:hypothetical protein
MSSEVGYLVQEIGHCFRDKGITQSMKPIFPNSLLLGNLRVNGVHPRLSLQRHVKAGVEESDILDPRKLL